MSEIYNKGVISESSNENAINKMIHDSMKMQISTPITMVTPKSFPPNGVLQKKDVSFFKIDMLSYDEEYPRREALENVLFAIDNPAYNFVYILEGTDDGINMYLGVARNGNENINNMSSSDYGKNLKSSFEGNFYGSTLTPLKGEKLDYLIGDDSSLFHSAGMIVGIPSVNEEKGKKEDFQGIDRLINSMLGKRWRIAVVSEPVSKSNILEIQESIYNTYNYLSTCSKMNLQHQEGLGKGTTNSSSYNYSQGHSSGANSGSSVQKGVSDSNSENHGSGNNSRGSSHGTNSSRVESYGSNTSDTTNISSGISAGSNSSVNSSTSFTFEVVNKKTQEIMSYIDEELLKRMKIGFSKGLYKTSLYYMAETPVAANQLKNSIMALFQGDGSSFSPLVARDLSEELLKASSLLSIYQNIYEPDNRYSPDVPILYGRDYSGASIGLNTYLTASEVSLIAGLPQKEVPGIGLKKAVNFGLNQKNINEIDSINLGTIVQKGRELQGSSFYLDKRSMSKHTFIAGVTGSGKTTTCHRLLEEFGKPYLVIEPAKTEYRTLINQDMDLVVFTIGNETVAPFRLNPFELIPGEVISSHIDMIKATFTSAFPMEGSMPQLMEEAIIKVYEDKGWNLATNQNDIYGDDAFDKSIDSFPILSDLLSAVQIVVDAKHFGDRLGSEYLGSLVSRLSNLTKGTKGYMLNCAHSVDFEFIANNNVILEMEELKSPEDKALIMGFVLTRMSSVIKQEHKKNKNYTHLTLVEEAHRLLAKPDYSDPGSKKAAVETFADLLAEVRKYGEGLIIVDQIPNKLASEVLKNTNTKIIHKILAKDDKEAVGDAMLMDDKQKEYLSALPVGQAVIFTENTDKPINVQIKRISDTNEAEIDNDVVKNRFNEKKPLFDLRSYYYTSVIPIAKLFFDYILVLAKGRIDESYRRRIYERIIKTAESENDSNEAILERLLDYAILVKGVSSQLSEIDRDMLLDGLIKHILENSISESDVSRILSLKMTLLKNN